MRRGACSFCVKESRTVETKCVFKGVVLVENRQIYVVKKGKNRESGVG